MWIFLHPESQFYSTLPGDNYGGMSGTSMSAPVVAGVMGLLRAYRPNYSIQRLQAAITDFADNIDAQNPGFVGLLGGGRLNSYLSLLNVDIAGIIAEIEPNNDFEEANPIVIGSTVEQAVIDPRRDADFYSFFAEGGDVIEVEIMAQRLEIDGQKSLLHPYLTLYAPDRITEVTSAYDTPPTEGLSGRCVFSTAPSLHRDLLY